MKKTEWGLVLLDALCADVLSIGAAMALLPLWGLQTPPFMLAVASTLLLVLFILAQRRPKVLLLALGCAAVLLLAAAVLTGKTEKWAMAAAGYVRWALAESVGGRPQLPVYLAAVLPVALGFWSLVRLGTRRRRFSLWAVSLLCAGLLGCLAVSRTENWISPFLLLCGGLILFLPRATLGKEGRLQAEILAALLALPILGLTVLLGPKADGDWRWAQLAYLVQDAQDFWRYHWGELPSLPGTSMRSMGLQPQRDQLGGDLEPDSTPVLTSTQSLLLRGRAFDLYTGSGWEESASEDDGNFRFDSFFWNGRRQEAFGLNFPEEAGKPLLDQLLTPVEADLKTQWNFRSLFLPYGAERVEITRNGDELYFNMQGEAYWKEPPAKGVEYHVEGMAWNFRDRDFDSNLLLLEKSLAVLRQDEGYARAEERYLQLPGSLPGWVYALAEEVTADCSSPYARAIALRDWLGENCEYTIAPGPGAGEGDFVADFLTSRRGYCTYYASALTVLCRCAGIPARYVTGYGMTRNGNYYHASQATAHAWTELYLQGVGWVPLDALSQSVFEDALSGQEEFQPGHAATQSMPAPPGELNPAEAEEQESGRGFDPLLLLWLLPLPLAAAGLALSKVLRRCRYRLPYVRRKYPEPAPAAEHCCAGLLRLLRLLDLQPRTGETLLDFWKRAAERLPSQADWQQTGRTMDRLRYAGETPGWEEIGRLCESYEALERHIRRTGGLLKRLRV